MINKKWTAAQKKYSNSAKGKAARLKYQQSAKGIEARKRYMANKKAKRLESKQSNVIAQAEPHIEQKVAESEIALVEKEAEVVKIKKAP